MYYIYNGVKVEYLDICLIGFGCQKVNPQDMKNIISLGFVFLLSSSVCICQTKKELEEKINQLTLDNQKIMSELISVKTQLLDVKQELASVKIENEKLRSQLASQSTETAPKESMGIIGNTPQNSNTGSVRPDDGRCQAITAKGTQCSRNAEPGSQYCWQHKSIYDPNSTQQKVVSTPAQKSSSSSTYGGRTIYTGPRGGKYYINSHGNKTYIKR